MTKKRITWTYSLTDHRGCVLNPYPFLMRPGIELWHGDCTQVIPRRIQRHSANLVAVDPPYGKGLQNSNGKAQYGRRGQDIQGDSDLKLMEWICKDIPQRLADDAWAFVFCDPLLAHYTQKWLEEGELFIEDIVVWDKKILGMGSKIRPQWEAIVVARRGDPVCTFNGGNVWDIARVSKKTRQGGSGLDVNLTAKARNKKNKGEKNDHPHEKPLALIHRIVEHFSRPGDVVVDYTLGSGTTARACLDSGRRCVGSELDGAYIPLIQERMSQDNLFIADTDALPVSQQAIMEWLG